MGSPYFAKLKKEWGEDFVLQRGDQTARRLPEAEEGAGLSRHKKKPERRAKRSQNDTRENASIRTLA
jgi:hypothetical protein